MIYLGSDHRGFSAKGKVKEWLADWDIEFIDCGPSVYNEEDDYPDFVGIVAQKVSENPTSNIGIVLGATGQGEAMVANRRRGVRAAVYYGGSEDILFLARRHNAANVLSLGVAPGDTTYDANLLDDTSIQRAVKVFLDTPFSEDPRHIRRIGKIDIQ